MEMKAIGIDIGTTSICVVGYDIVSGAVTDSMSAKNEFLPGTFCQDPDRIVDAAKRLLQTMLASLGGADVIGVSSQMHGILYVNREGEAVSPFYTWKAECGNKPLFDGTYASALTEKTKMPMYAGYGTVTHFYNGQTGQIPKEAVYLAGIGDYLVMKLCGRKAPLMSATMAASLGGFSLQKMEFDLENLKDAGVDIAFYPPVKASPEEAGSHQGIPVYSAVGDNQASVYAAAYEDERLVSINVGTGSQVSLFDRRYEALVAGEIRPYTQNGYLYVQASVNGGKVYEKLAVFTEEIIRAFTGIETDRDAVYTKMEELGMQKSKTPLHITPSLYGSRTDAGRTGSIEGLTETVFHPADLIRAYVAGMAEELYELYQMFPEPLRKGRTAIVASGNGIRRNALLRQEIEKKFSMQVLVRERAEEAAAGAAMMVSQRWAPGEDRGK